MTLIFDELTTSAKIAEKNDVSLDLAIASSKKIQPVDRQGRRGGKTVEAEFRIVPAECRSRSPLFVAFGARRKNYVD